MWAFPIFIISSSILILHLRHGPITTCCYSSHHPSGDEYSPKAPPSSSSYHSHLRPWLVDDGIENEDHYHPAPLIASSNSSRLFLLPSSPERVKGGSLAHSLSPIFHPPSHRLSDGSVNVPHSSLLRLLSFHRRASSLSYLISSFFPFQLPFARRVGGGAKGLFSSCQPPEGKTSFLSSLHVHSFHLEEMAEGPLSSSPFLSISRQVILLFHSFREPLPSFITR